MSLVETVNGWSAADAETHLTHCCGATKWVRAVLAGRPYASEALLRKAVDRALDMLDREDWLEAFRHHPKIGDVDSLRKKFATTSHLTTKEQAGVAGAADGTLQRLKDGNDRYFAQHGFIFIVFATGKTAEEMLDILTRRLENDSSTELLNAAAEQRKITHLRLEKLTR